MDFFETQIYQRYQRLILECEGTHSGYKANTSEPKKVYLSDLVDSYDAFCFDGYGTLYNRGLFVYPSSLEWISILREKRKFLRLVTNAASDLDTVLAADAQKRGFSFTTAETISSGSLLKDGVESLRKSGVKKISEVFYIGRETGKNVLMANDIVAVENPVEPIVAVSSATATEKDFNHAVEILSCEGGLLLVLNPDVCAPNIDGSRSPVSGYLCERLRQLSNAETLYLGKPFPAIWKRVRDTLPVDARVLMIGDTLGTDIFGACVAGFDSALVVGRNVLEENLKITEENLGVLPNYYLELG